MGTLALMLSISEEMLAYKVSLPKYREEHTDWHASFKISRRIWVAANFSKALSILDTRLTSCIEGAIHSCHAEVGARAAQCGL